MFSRMLITNKKGYGIDLTFDMSYKDLTCIHVDCLTPLETGELL